MDEFVLVLVLKNFQNPISLDRVRKLQNDAKKITVAGSHGCIERGPARFICPLKTKKPLLLPCRMERL